MNVKHSMMFGLVSRLVSYVDSWSQQGRKQGVAWWKHRERRQEDVKRTLLQMSLCPLSTLLGMWQWTFKMQQQLSFLKPSADIWDSGQPALLLHRKWDEGQGCSLSAKGTVEGMAQDDRWQHHSGTRQY